jgi:hypothetical protein
MKKLLMILMASFALAACGDGSNRSEANQDAEENTETTEPSVTDETNESGTMNDTTTTTMGDTTATSPQATPSR